MHADFRRPTVALETMGCKLNLADSELLARDFARAGFEVVAAGGAADVYVLNTCTVTHVADRKARHLARAARRRSPGAYVVLTGCYAERAPEELRRLAGVDLVAGNTHKRELVSLVAGALRRRAIPFVGDRCEDSGRPEGRAGGPPGDGGATDDSAGGLTPRMPFLPSQSRAFVKIQEGCNDYCSYCIIPKTRGRSTFFNAGEVIEEVRDREARGYLEVVLTGTQLGDYGIELPGSRRPSPDRRDQGTQGDPLAALLTDVLAATRIPRIRLSSIQPQDVTPGLLRLWENPRLCPHFHLPLQSGSDPVLRRMRRRYDTRGYLEAIGRIRSAVPGVSITTDVIAGFPGETDEEFQATVHVCLEAGLADVHVFPFSARAGTLAAKMPDPVPEPVKQERAECLLALARETRERHWRGFLGCVRTVLWEERKAVPGVSPEPVWHGLTDNYLRVYSADSQELSGPLLPTRLVAVAPQGIWGRAVA